MMCAASMIQVCGKAVFFFLWKTLNQYRVLLICGGDKKHMIHDLRNSHIVSIFLILTVFQTCLYLIVTFLLDFAVHALGVSFHFSCYLLLYVCCY